MEKRTKGKREEKRVKRNKKRKRILIGSIAFLLIAGYLISCFFVPKDTVLHGVIMNGVDLSGCTKEEAEKLLAEQYKKDYENSNITVKALEQEYRIPMYSSLSFDEKKAQEAAFSYGHTNFFLGGGMMILGYIQPRKMVYYPEVTQEDNLKKEYENTGVAAINTTVQTTYELKDETLDFTKGTTGYSVDLEGLTQGIKDAVAINDYETVLEAPLLQGKVEDLDMDAVYEKVHKKKREATLDPKKNYKIVRSVTGIDFDKEEAKKALEEAEEGKTVSVAIVKEKPTINTTLLKKHLFEKDLGTCTTYVSGTNARISNVKLAASTINGIILMPGEEFSYNDRVGERTAERGYQAAPAYFNGKSVNELGGGICQVSSTLYKATVLANMEITEHHNHTYESAYIGLGMDATVSWGGPDFKFKNNMDYPIKITAEYSGGALTCAIVGAKLNDHKVIFSSEVLKTVGFGTKYIDDDTLPKGTEKVLSSGHNGYVVQTYRTVVDGSGKEISSKKEDYNVYSKKDQEVARGTKVVSKKKKQENEKDTTEKAAE